MRTNTKKLLGAVAVAGLVATTGTAFTAGGLARESSFDGSDFLGGEVTQTVTGATLSDVAYVADASGTSVTAINLTFVSALDASAQVVTVDVNNSGSPITCTGASAPANSTSFSCTITGGATVSSVDVIVAGADRAA